MLSTNLVCFLVVREALDKLQHVVADGRNNAITKRNKALSAAEKEISRFEKELSSAAKEVNFRVILYLQSLTI